MKSLRDEIEDRGYHIFSIERNQEHNYYPGAFNDYPGVSLSTLNLNDMITVTVFYFDGSDPKKILTDIYIERMFQRENEVTQ